MRLKKTVTTETPWDTESFDKNSSVNATDALESVGFTFFEQSSEHATGALAALQQAPSSQSTDLVPTSRRALRDAERAQPRTLRTRRPSAPDSAPTALAPTEPTPVAPTEPSPAIRTVSAPPVSAAPTRPASTRVPLRRRIAQKAFPPAVMIVAAGLLIGTSVPATALFDPDAPTAATVMAAATVSDEIVDPTLTEGQVVEVEVGSDLVATVASREEWGVTSYAEMLRLRYGNVNYSYSTSGSGAIRWPFPYSTQISSGFGDRVAPCRGCSSYHRGLDFIAPYGAPVGAIAEGVVTAVGRYSSYGYRVEIEHVINGQRVKSLYAHLVENSSILEVGATVEPGEIVGALGLTGLTTGAHLHLEIHVDDIPIDPFAWLQANAS